MRLRGTMGCYPKLLKNETKCVNTVELVVCSLYLHMRYDLIIGIILYIIPFIKKKKKNSSVETNVGSGQRGIKLKMLD